MLDSDDKHQSSSQKELLTLERERVMKVLRPYLLCDIKNTEGIDINDEFWLAPELQYWPSLKMMKQLVTLASTAESLSLIHI